jgi:hypothetical protein
MPENKPDATLVVKQIDDGVLVRVRPAQTAVRDLPDLKRIRKSHDQHAGLFQNLVVERKTDMIP